MILAKLEDTSKVNGNAGVKLLANNKARENKLYTVFQDTIVDGKPAYPELTFELRDKYKKEKATLET